ncbi:MAG: PAS domain S-box protein [Rhodopila sp.]|nr:PAS domain S-box protein [Rhodopila sp.]
MAPDGDAKHEASVEEAEALTLGLAQKGEARRRRGHDLSLSARLLLLVVASVLPLVGMGAVREYLHYRDDRERTYDNLLTVARGMSVSVERELELHVSALETLATSPALQSGDLAGFDQQAEAFMSRLPAGSTLELETPDLQVVRLYGVAVPPDRPLPHRDPSAAGNQVFDTGQPLVTDLRVGPLSGLQGFSVDVPVFRESRVAYDLLVTLRPPVLQDLIAHQRLPPDIMVSVIDGAGTIVARQPDSDRFIGSKVVPDLWAELRGRSDGITKVRTLDGVQVVAGFTHVAPFNWAVVIGAPEDIVLGPIRGALIRTAEDSAIVLIAGVILATFAARRITGPIARVRRMAVHDDQIDPAHPAVTGLPETDTVAQALVTAAAERQEVAKALAESEQRFRALFEGSASGTMLLDPDTMRIIDCNEVAAASVGYSVEELRLREVTDFAMQSSPERMRAICDAVVSGQSWSYETRITGRLGPRDLLVAVAPVQVSGRTLVLINGIDVTDLRRAEAGLRVNEERLELARQGANLGIWDWDVANDTLTWSEHQWRLHGLEPRPDTPPLEVWRQTLHPDDRRHAQEELVRALKSPDHSYAIEYSVVLPDGSLRRLMGRGQTVRDADGRAVRMVGINMDVTARYEAEMARDRLISMLETERSRLSEIIEALPIGVGIVDSAGRVILGNAAMQRIAGPVLPSMSPDPRGEWIGYDADGNRMSPENFPIRRALRLGETTLPGTEFIYRDQDGTETWIRVGGLPLRWEGGKVQEALGIFQDIDAAKRLLDIQQRINAALEQRVREEMAAREAAQQRAAHAERMHALGQIAGGIAHDFNNVLQAVSGGAALIERRPEDPERVLRNARMVLDAAKRGAAITSRLLAFARRGDLRAENVDVSALLTDMGEVLTHTLGGSVVCDVHVLPGLPPLFADRGQLETVLVNLATNARDAMPSGGTLTLSADTEIVSTGLPHPAGLAPGGYVRIIVSDTGTGMEQSVLARVTEPFFTTKEPGKGTGLGLAMAKGFVEQSGGSLSIDSAVGQGTRITLWLPNATGGVGALTGEGPRPDADPGKPCVLLVDDDTIVRDVLTLSLEDSGYAVLPADGATSALNRLTSGERVDIIVSDLTMPGMDGLTLIRAVQEWQPSLPAILLTGYASDGAALAIGGAISGTFSLLRKPVSGTQLADRIASLLAARKQTSRA